MGFFNSLARIVANTGLGLKSALWILFAVVLALGVGGLYAANVLSDALWLSILWLGGLAFIWFALFNFLDSAKKSTAISRALGIAVAVLGAFTITLYAAALGDYFAAPLTQLVLRDFPIFLETLLGVGLPNLDANTTISSVAAEKFSERNREIANIALGTVVSVTVVISFSGVFIYLHKIVNILGLSDQQLSLAKKLKLAAKGAIPPGQRLSQLYPKDVQILRPMPPRRQFPLVTEGGVRARVKLILQRSGMPAEGDDFRLDTLRQLLHSAEIELTQSVFFVYDLDTTGDTIVCYGTGAELEALYQMGDPYRGGTTIGAAFVRALNFNNRMALDEIVPMARAILQSRHPSSDILLSTKSMHENDTMEAVMNVMQHGQRPPGGGTPENMTRILLQSDKAPFERGFVGAAEISRFLFGGVVT